MGTSWREDVREAATGEDELLACSLRVIHGRAWVDLSCSDRRYKRTRHGRLKQKIISLRIKKSRSGNSGLKTVPVAGSCWPSYSNVKQSKIELQEAQNIPLLTNRHHWSPQHHYLHCCKSQKSPSFRAVESENRRKSGPRRYYLTLAYSWHCLVA